MDEEIKKNAVEKIDRETMASDAVSGTIEKKKKNMKVKQIGIIGIVAVFLIVIICIGIGVYNLPAKRLVKQMDLGQKCLLEEDYEGAIVAFNKIIEMDPMNVEAYIGLADAYLGLKDMDAEMDALNRGYELTKDERLQVKMEEVSAILAKESEAATTKLENPQILYNDKDEVINSTEEEMPEETEEELAENIEEEEEQEDVRESSEQAGENQEWVDDLYYKLLADNYIEVINILKSPDLKEKLAPFLWSDWAESDDEAAYKMTASDGTIFGVVIYNNISIDVFISYTDDYGFEYTKVGDHCVTLNNDGSYIWMIGQYIYFSDGEVRDAYEGYDGDPGKEVIITVWHV